ncbi:MAG: hypothetical protein QOI43_3066, partial [Gaiellales bacterium]|nr:hypothetical protein [Gaiellales bacterium]
AVAARPRVRLGLNVAVGAVLIAVLALTVTHKEKPNSAFDLGTPVKTVRVNWDDISRLEGQVAGPSGVLSEHGYLETRVSAVEFGPHGWRVRASIANKSPLAVHVVSGTAASGASSGYPNQRMSLIVQADEGSGTKRLNALSASAFAPALPSVLKPHSTWTGTFAGSDAVARGTLFYAGFGEFQLASSFSGGRPFSTSSAKSATAP